MDVPPPIRTRTILLVDDEADVREAMKDFLEDWIDGARIRTADAGESALELLRSEKVDLIVTDYRMPGMDGIAFLNEAKKIAPETPHVLLTAFGYDALRELGLEAVGHRMLWKPCEADALRKEVEDALANPLAPTPADPAAATAPVHA